VGGQRRLDRRSEECCGRQRLYRRGEFGGVEQRAERPGVGVTEGGSVALAVNLRERRRPRDQQQRRDCKGHRRVRSATHGAPKRRSDKLRAKPHSQFRSDLLRRRIRPGFRHGHLFLLPVFRHRNLLRSAGAHPAGDAAILRGMLSKSRRLR
jgi:hypothetical protein